MKLELFNDEANKIWQRHAGNSATDLLQLELGLYKKLLNFFQAGDYYYYLFNFKTFDLDIISPEVEAVLGYSPSEVTLPFLMDKMHPDDMPWFLAFENKTSHFFSQLPADKIMKYKSRLDFRLKKKDGTYIRVLHQAVIAQMEDNGSLIRTLGVHTDITHLKKEGKPVMSLIGLDGEPSYLDIDIKIPFIKSKETLSVREKEVLALLIEGKASKEIANLLHISKQTVDTHRKNMIHKNNLANTSELIGKAISNGWL